MEKGKKKETKKTNSSSTEKKTIISEEDKIEKEKWKSEQIEEERKLTLEENEQNHKIQLISIIGEIEGYEIYTGRF